MIGLFKIYITQKEKHYKQYTKKKYKMKNINYINTLNLRETNNLVIIKIVKKV